MLSQGGRERERERERTQKITNSSKYGQDNHDQSEVHDGGAKYRIVREKMVYKN